MCGEMLSCEMEVKVKRRVNTGSYLVYFLLMFLLIAVGMDSRALRGKVGRARPPLNLDPHPET